MDISKVAAASEEGAVLELKDPRGEPALKPDGISPVTITLAGTESKRWKKARNAANERYLKSLNPRTGKTERSGEDLLADAADQLAAVTLAWDGILRDGQELDCTQANAKRLYLDSDFVREQVDLFVGDRKNFWKPSSIV